LDQVDKNFNPSLRSPLYFIRKGLYRKIREYAPTLSGNILDFGCGAKPYQSLFINANSYTGVDYASEGHDHSNEHIDYYYDGHKLPFENEQYDNIFSSEVMEHIFNPEEILAELHRVLKPGGKILLTCPFVFPEHEVPVDYARYTRFALLDMLKKNGFTVVTVDKSGDFASAIAQMRVLYFRDHVMQSVPLFGKIRLFQKFCRQVIIPIMNGYFLALRRVLPKRQELYLNTIILAEKSNT
jgi:SAM-dependent methyltransferase